MLTQAVAGEALTSLGGLLHRMRVAWNIPQECDCEEVKKLKGVKQHSKPVEQILPDVRSNNFLQCLILYFIRCTNVSYFGSDFHKGPSN